MDVSGRRLLVYSRIRLRLVRQWIHVWRCLVYFYGPLHLAVNCSTLFVPEEYNTWIFLGDDFRMDAVFSSLLGSTVDTYLCQFTEVCGRSRIA